MMEEGSVTVRTLPLSAERIVCASDTERGEPHNSLLCRQPANHAFHRQAAPIGAFLGSPGSTRLPLNQPLSSFYLTFNPMPSWLIIFFFVPKSTPNFLSLPSTCSRSVGMECLLNETRQWNTKAEGKTWTGGTERKCVRERERAWCDDVIAQT